MTKSKRSWSSIFRDIFMMTFSVLLAFMLNSWNQERKDKNEATSYLEGIYEELEQNKVELEEKLDYHQDLLDSLQANPVNVKLILKPPTLSKEAWVLSENEVFKKYTDRELYQKIAKAYYAHDYLMSHVNKASDYMMELNIFSSYYLIESIDMSDEKIKEFRAWSRSGWVPVFQDWVGAEYRYLKLINAILTPLDSTEYFDPDQGIALPDKN